MPTPKLPTGTTKTQVDAAARRDGFPEADYPFYSPVNQCGPDGWKGKLVPDSSHVLKGCGADWAPACDQHDRDYMTVGMNRDEADQRFKKALDAAADKYIQRFLDDMIIIIRDVASDDKYWEKEAREIEECVKKVRPKVCFRFGVLVPCGIEDFLDCVKKTVMVDVEKVRRVVKQVPTLVARATTMTPESIALMKSEPVAYYEAVHLSGEEYYTKSQQKQRDYEAWLGRYLSGQ